MNAENEKKILIVEDDPSWQNILSELVRDLGFKADIAENIDQAEEIIRNSSHRLAFVDLSLDIKDHSNVDGYKILQMIREYDPGCIPLLLSGYVNVESAVKAMKEYGAFTCLQKENFSRSEFKQTVKDMLRQPDQAQFRSISNQNIDNESRFQKNDEIVSFDLKALVVDDDAGWRDLLSELLGERGYSVQVSGSFGEAIGYLGRNKYDLALIDLALDRNFQHSSKKDFDGFRLLENCQVNGITTIVVSGMGSPDEIEGIYEKFQVFSFLEKQAFERGTFLHTIDLAQQHMQVEGDLKALTERELQVLKLLAQGLINKEIASQLFVSPNTIKRHLKSIFEKLEVHNRSAATAKVINAGLMLDKSR
ncbi:MAG: response regulator [Anaerolineaceae bacterium]|nr:response regulator [Anaerolineaceae bacterium]